MKEWSMGVVCPVNAVETLCKHVTIIGTSKILYIPRRSVYVISSQRHYVLSYCSADQGVV